MRYSIYARAACALLDISSIGYAADVSVTHFGPGVRQSYIIHYVIAGKGYFNGNPVFAGQGFLITPGMPEHYFADSQDPWEFLWVICDDPKIENLLPLYHADPQTNIFQYDYIYAIQEFSSFLITNTHTVYDAYELLEFFLKIFKYQQKDDFPKTIQTNAEIYIAAAQKYITSNIHNPITVSELTDFLGVSQPYLFRIFKERLLKSPKQYILEQKLTCAQMLLKETDMSITYVANSVGFPDVLSFSKCFHAKLGISPQNYRKQKRP